MWRTPFRLAYSAPVTSWWNWAAQGTSSWRLQAPIIDERLYLDFHLIPGVFVPNGCMATTGSLLRWFQRELAAGTDLEALDREAAAVGIGAGGLVALPYFLGEKTPINDPLARGVFAGLHLGHTRGHLFRALLEGVGFAVLQHLEVLRDLGLCPECVRLTGGGARSALWRQILADVLNRPVECACHLSGSALGAAFAAADRTALSLTGTISNHWSDSARPRCPTPDGTLAIANCSRSTAPCTPTSWSSCTHSHDCHCPPAPELKFCGN